MSNSLAKKQLKNAIKKTSKKSSSKIKKKVSNKKTSLVNDKRKRQDKKKKEMDKKIKNSHKYKVNYKSNTGTAKNLVKSHLVIKNRYDITKGKMVKELNKIGYSVKIKGDTLTVLNIWTKEKPGKY